MNENQIEAKITVADRIINSVLYGDPRGFGYSHPTGREYFEEVNKEILKKNE